MSTQANNTSTANSYIQYSPMVSGKSLQIGDGFNALSFKEQYFDGLMDPLVMVDHYTMTSPTFGVHPHAGMSAVSILFEDSQGSFHNRDSLGNSIHLAPGDLYWLQAGSGALHDEAPCPNARIHGVQVFVNLPARLEHGMPDSLHVRASDMPVLENDDYRVRVMLGESGGVNGAKSPALPATVLDGKLNAGGRFSQTLPAHYSAWVYPVNGSIQVKHQDTLITIPAGKSLSLRNEKYATDITLQTPANSEAQFVLISAEPIRESFVQRGPFVMSTIEALDRIEKKYHAGKLGTIHN